jgi:hypothetical protein
MNSSEIYRNPRAARESLIDLRSMFLELGFEIVSESFYAHEAWLVAKREDLSVTADWFWDPGLVIRVEGMQRNLTEADILAAINHRGVREDRVI